MAVEVGSIPEDGNRQMDLEMGNIQKLRECHRRLISVGSDSLVLIQ